MDNFKEKHNLPKLNIEYIEVLKRLIYYKYESYKNNQITKKRLSLNDFTRKFCQTFKYQKTPMLFEVLQNIRITCSVDSY